MIPLPRVPSSLPKRHSRVELRGSLAYCTHSVTLGQGKQCKDGIGWWVQLPSTSCVHVQYQEGRPSWADSCWARSSWLQAYADTTTHSSLSRSTTCASLHRRSFFLLASLLQGQATMRCSNPLRCRTSWCLGLCSSPPTSRWGKQPTITSQLQVKFTCLSVKKINNRESWTAMSRAGIIFKCHWRRPLVEMLCDNNLLYYHL